PHLPDSPQRQANDGMRGLVCPLETPESERVGLDMFLARSAILKRTAVWKSIPGPEGRNKLIQAAVRRLPLFQLAKDVNENEPDQFLGISASLIPFVDYDDPNRAMLGAKNLKQAMTLVEAEPPLIRTAFEEDLDLKLGINLTVAYMPWYGYNFEDA